MATKYSPAYQKPSTSRLGCVYGTDKIEAEKPGIFSTSNGRKNVTNGVDNKPKKK